MHAARVFAVMMLLTGCERASDPKPHARVDVTKRKPAESYSPEFPKSWEDGHTERSTYDLTSGGRKGRAVASFRMAGMSNSRRAESERNGDDVFPIMKMNVLSQIEPEAQEMLSVLAALTSVNDLPPGTVARVSYSRQAQDGQEWGSLLVHSKSASHTWHSFREPWADGQRLIPFVSDRSVAEDALPLCARRMAWPILRLGQEMNVRIISSLRNLPLDIAEATLSLSQTRQTTTAPAGSFRTHTFTARWKNGPTKIWDVETEPPHRIIRWQSGDEKGLLGESTNDPH